jgi:hypothetical protein
MALDGNDPTLTGAPGAGGDVGHEPGRVFSAEYVQQLRRENAGYRTKVREMESRIGSENRALRIDLALHQSKDLAGLDLRYIKFLLAEEKALDNLDPNAPDFRERLDEKLSDLLGRRPEVRAGVASRVPPTTSGVPSGGPGAVSDQLSYADLKSMSPDQVVAAHRSGRTSWLLGRRG